MATCRYSGNPSAYFCVATVANKLGVAMDFSIGCLGLLAVIKCCSQQGQA